MPDCTAINDLLQQESGRISGQIYEKNVITSPWLGLVKKTEFPEGMGKIISEVTQGRARPTSDTPDWETMASSDGTNNNCLPDVTLVNADSFTQTYQLKRKALESNDFCVEDLRWDWDADQQIDKKVQEFGRYVSQEWTNRYKQDYIDIALNKVIEDSSMTIAQQTALPATLASSQLTQGTLERLYDDQILNGAPAAAMDSGAPTFILITSRSTSQNLIKGNDDIRQDLRYADPKSLLPAYNVNRVYGGYMHLIDPHLPRYNYVGGAYVRVNAWVNVSLGGGRFEQRPNPAYQTAEFEGSMIFNSEVFESAVPRPISKVGAAEFDTVNYMGEFNWLNIRERICNPDGTIGFWRAILAEAAKPVRPEYGYVIIHRRCAPARHLQAYCS